MQDESQRERLRLKRNLCGHECAADGLSHRNGVIRADYNGSTDHRGKFEYIAAAVRSDDELMTRNNFETPVVAMAGGTRMSFVNNEDHLNRKVGLCALVRDELSTNMML